MYGMDSILSCGAEFSYSVITVENIPATLGAMKPDR